MVPLLGKDVASGLFTNHNVPPRRLLLDLIGDGIPSSRGIDPNFLGSSGEPAALSFYFLL